ncbi:MAG: cytochrome c oxidase subunit II [Asticcacaulis sp.]
MAVAGAAAMALTAPAAFAEGTAGIPTDKAIGWQPAATGLKADTIWFYNDILFPIITAICVLVFVLLAWIVIRYNKRANPVAARFSHNTFIEILWTLVPVCILVFIAFFSLSLLREFNDMPKPDVVVKATGNQWFWTYDYPELGVSDIESRLLPEAADLKKAHASGKLYLLDTDNQLVVPVNKVIHVETTGADVIHSWTVPSFGIKMDAIPGRLNNTWFKATKIGTYYGECSELCGKDHAYMPIEVKVVSDADFDAFIVKNGGKTKAMLAAEAASAAAASQQAAAVASSSAAAASESSVTSSTHADLPKTAGAPPAASSASAGAASSAAAPAGKVAAKPATTPAPASGAAH